jgi:exonuclease SbcC
VRNALEGSWRVFDGQRDSVGALSPPQPDRRDLLTEWTALAEWAAAERPAQLESAELEGRAATSTEREIRQQLATLAATCAGVGVEPAAAARGAESVAASEAATVLSAMREAVVVAATDAAHMLRSIVEGLAELERLLAERETVAGEAGVAQMLGNQLTATGFQRWLVAEALDLLVDGASETLRRLSADQYSLSRDDRNEFVVIDHRNADERRSAKSLSGGETFQASLALALALADQLAGLSTAGAARLESIFLDEGFGTLDPETLSVVADAIESLGSEERMVGVVTHVRELAERVPVRFEVRKGSRTSTVERLSG